MRTFDNREPSPPSDRSETALWVRLCEGDAAALEALFRSHYAALYHYGLTLTPRPELVKDAVQDVFAYLWEKRSRLALPQSVKAYLMVSVRRCLVRRLEAERQRNATHESFVDEHAAHGFGASEDAAAGEEATPARQVREAFEQIPARMREALYLKVYGGLAHQEIAQVMEISPQVARNYVSGALKRLRQLLSSAK